MQFIKMDKRSEKVFHQKDVQMAKSHTKNVLNIISHLRTEN